MSGPSSSRWLALVDSCADEAGIMDEIVEATVREAFRAVPRADFVDPVHSEAALTDVDLPIEFEQWLTRPSVQIRMLGLIGLRRRMRVLELGYGSGYLCAVLAHTGAQVFGVEKHGPLAQSSRKRLDSLRHHGVVVRRGDGHRGWEESSPFDAIVCSYPVPNEQALPLEQLGQRGLLVAPLIQPDQSIRLSLWSRIGDSMRRVSFEVVDFR